MKPLESTSGNSDRARLEEALSIATEAYIYGYPLVTMDMTRKQMTNVARPDEVHAPIGQLVKMRGYPTADFHTVTAPNADTLYISAWFGVSSEPWILSVPEMGGRYYLLPLFSSPERGCEANRKRSEFEG